MQTRTRVALWALGIGGGVFLVVAGLAAVIVLRNTTAGASGEREAVIEIERIHARFPARPPLVEIVDPRRGAIRINHPPASAERRHVEAFHVLAWAAANQRLVRTSAPIWMMRLSLQNVLSALGLGLGPWNLTVADVERYGPGVVLDYSPPGGGRVLVWVQ
jgi:hypothetical protein